MMNMPWRMVLTPSLRFGCLSHWSLHCGSRRSIPLLLIHHVAQWLAPDEPANIVEKQIQVPACDAGRVTGNVWREDDAPRHFPKRVIRRQWFCFENIESGTGNLTGFQCCDQIVQDNDGAAADVDEAGVAFHLAELRSLKHRCRLRCVRRCDHDEIALSEQLR